MNAFDNIYNGYSVFYAEIEIDWDNNNIDCDNIDDC